MPVRSKVEKPVVHISLNPHPDDILTDTELRNTRTGVSRRRWVSATSRILFSSTRTSSRHHLHIVSVNVDENGRRIRHPEQFFTGSKRITAELERKYGLHDAERKNLRTDTPLRRVDASAGDVKRQAGNIVKAIIGRATGSGQWANTVHSFPYII